MFTYRVTKYDPHQRDRDDIFLGEDWTSVSDIGRTIGGVTLSKSEYLRVENAYIQAIQILLAASEITSMLMTDFEMRTSGEALSIDDDVFDACRLLRNNSIVSDRHFEDVIRGCLREYIWCRLSGPHGAHVHFGYDYYMYVGLPKPANPRALPHGIFVEEFLSPYIALDE